LGGGGQQSRRKEGEATRPSSNSQARSEPQQALLVPRRNLDECWQPALPSSPADAHQHFLTLTLTLTLTLNAAVVEMVMVLGENRGGLGPKQA